MRALAVVVSLACLAVPSSAFARPKTQVAVAPIRGDRDGSITEAVVDALAGKDFAVVTPDDLTAERKKLGLAADLAPKTVRKLAPALDVVAIIGGTARTAGRKRSVHIDVHRVGKPDSGFTIEFKTTDSAAFHRGIHDQVLKRLGGTPASADDEPADDAADKPVAQHDDDSRSLADTDRKRRAGADDPDRKRASPDDAADRKRKSDDTDRKRASSDDAPDRKRKSDDVVDRKRASSDDAVDRKRASSDDTSDRKRNSSDDDTGDRKRRSSDDTADRRRKRIASDDERDRSDDEAAVRKRKSRRGETYAPGQALARAEAGASVAQRQLTYDTRSGFTQVPPRIRTTAGGGRIDGEVYPFALASAGDRLARLGLAASYDKTFGLSIKIPNTAVSAPIDQSHYALGARYRFNLGSTSTIKVGLDYVRRHNLADRDKLTSMAITLDAPDVDYTAIAPGVSAHVPITPTITALAGLDAMLMLDAGPIQRTPSYGPATVYGIEALAGVDVAITPQIGVRVVVEYSRISLSFNGKGQMTTTR
ncbi:MAG TPA: hypothetical protein VLM79_09615, partial [Kofleriaceae bacterium]|nr:hypothetical protein [Kofleriaceae bacterium]